jgi:hypothetical protein
MAGWFHEAGGWKCHRGPCRIDKGPPRTLELSGDAKDLVFYLFVLTAYRLALYTQPITPVSDEQDSS